MTVSCHIGAVTLLPQCTERPQHADRRAAMAARRQRARRQYDHDRRRALLRSADELRAMGLPARRSAALLDCSPRTLRHWRRLLTQASGALPLRGRPSTTCSVDVRNEVIRTLHHLTGPSIGLPALRALLPTVRRCVLAELLARYRRVWRQRYCPFGFRLHWHQAAAVWAMDYSKAPFPIDGSSRTIFAVRDLATSYQIAWQPVMTETAEEAIPILRNLFRTHGAPLVLKSDNGSAFIALAMQAAMAEERVVQLFSPAGRPSYNGGLERSNRLNKQFTAQQATSAGRALHWQSADLEAARTLANTVSRPWGHRGPTPQQAWEAREPIDESLRRALAERLSEQRVVAAGELGIDLLAPLEHAARTRLDRQAIAAVLKQLDLLSYERGSRVTRKPPRVSSADIERRAARLRAASNTSAEAAAPLPPLSGHRPCVDHTRRAPPPVDNDPCAQNLAPAASSCSRSAAHEQQSLKPRTNILAPPLPSHTMQAPAAAADTVHHTVASTAAAHCERSPPSPRRSPVTLLIRLLKAARIMR